MMYLRPVLGFLARFRPFCLNSGHYAWIWAILLGFGPFCLDLGYLAEFGSEMMDLRPELGFSGKIWAILLEFGPLCLDLGHFA